MFGGVAEPLRRESVEKLLREEPQAVVDLVLQQAAVIAEQRELIEQQRAAIQALEKRVRQLEEALQERGGGPGAAPFRIEPHKRKEKPKRPGREAGHRGEFRMAPQQIDETIEVPLRQCPSCGQAIEQSTPFSQTIIELPAVRPLCVRLITHRARCRRNR